VRSKVKPIPVRFIQKNAPYNVGEIAGFDMKVARSLVNAKRAVFINESDADAPEEATAAPSKVFEAVHIGGGYYEVDGHRVKGKKAAEEYAAELTKSHGEAPEAEE